MLKKHKNGFLEIIRNEGFDVRDFHAEECLYDGRHAFVIAFRDTPLRFIARNADHSYHDFDFKHTGFGPGEDEVEYCPESDWTNIETVYNAFRGWLKKAVQVYIDDLLEPDLWGQVLNQGPLVSSSMLDEEETSKFQDDEKVQLRLAINEFQLLVSKTFQPSQVESKIIENRLDYLSNRLNELNRIDWRALALSTILSISIALSLDTERGKVLFTLFKQVFWKILHLLQ
jgi:hypothetical protein